MTVGTYLRRVLRVWLVTPLEAPHLEEVQQLDYLLLQHRLASARVQQVVQATAQLLREDTEAARAHLRWMDTP